MKIRVLHIVGGSPQNGAYQGAYILHKALLNSKIDSKLLNDTPFIEKNKNSEDSLIYFNNTKLKKYSSKLLIYLEKIIKSLYLPIPRSTYTLGLFGYDITKFDEYKKSDIIHIHWLSEGFVDFRTLLKSKKPIVWTMRDMWPFTGGSHYTMDFKNYEKGLISTFIKKLKKKSFKNNIRFVAISDWLKNQAEKSIVLQNNKVIRIYNNINLNDFKIIEKTLARSNLNIKTKKHVILFGAQNPQSERKGWAIFFETLKKLDKSKYFVLIFGSFWSHKMLDEIGIEYKSLGFIHEKTKLNMMYSSADFFVASSLQEAFGKTWAEALACETPIVCFKNTSVSEFVEHKSNGFVCNGFEPEKLKEGIEWLSTEKKYEKLKNNCKNQKILNLDANIIAQKYIEVYNDAINSKKPNL